MSSIDLRGPFVLDTRDLGRRAGNQREYTRTVPAPPDLGIDVFAVPEGDPVEVEVRLEAVVDGVLATGSAFAGLKGECVRCLDPIEDEVEAHFQELYLYDAPERDDEEDDDLSVVVDEHIDLETAIRNAIVLEIPFQPLCSEDCPGLCQECGASLKEDPGHTHDAAIDPRWAGLASLKGDED
ncbi:YceD family protein [Nocardioides sp. Iso805N]|uniref:YceD family protein n=1 Tax=Nocardioides sp. Iso805N TaxID=1283287 RepID=UPI0003813357|nr:YceD family protein [Nocardioides sp. Iso805N]